MEEEEEKIDWERGRERRVGWEEDDCDEERWIEGKEMREEERKEGN